MMERSSRIRIGIAWFFVFAAATASLAGVTTRVSATSANAEGNGNCEGNNISGDGRYVVFDSEASNLASNDTNGHRDVFLRDLALGTTVLMSHAFGSGPANESSYDPAISRDGRYVAF